MTYTCPKCNGPLMQLHDYDTEVIFYCSTCDEKVKAKRMARALEEIMYGRLEQ